MDKGEQKNQSYKIILVLDIEGLKFNSILTFDSFEIQFNGE